MGASTVPMTASKELPENVIGVLADCGFTSAKDIMYKVIRQMKLLEDIEAKYDQLCAITEELINE